MAVEEVRCLLEFYDAAGIRRLGYLGTEELSDFCRVTGINGICTLKFNCLVNNKTLRLIESENRIRFDNAEYIIKTPVTSLSDEGVISVSCVSAAEELLYRYIDGELAIPSASMSYAATRVLENTGWQLTYCDPTITSLRNVKLENLNRLEALNELLILYGAVDEYLYGPFVRFDTLAKTISLYNEIGREAGVKVCSAKNLKSLDLSYDSKGLVTRLYVKGKDGLSISDINNGCPYIENFSYFTALGYNTADADIRERLVREDVVVYDKIPAPVELLEQGQRKLAAVAWPKLSVSLELADLFRLYGEELYQISIGDWVTVEYTAPQEISVAVKVRVIEMTEYPFEPHRNSITVGTPKPQISDAIKPAVTTSRIITRNRHANSLLQGFINTAATLINGTKGLLTILDNTIDFWGIDDEGRRNGKGVRLSPGGLGITEDGGQTYKTAVTGEGVLSSTVVINELYALSTDDEYTKIMADGLHVFDQNNRERLHAGHWTVDAIERFGLRITASDGTTVILDDRGMLQTWQIQVADNVDASHPLKIIFYVPPGANLNNGKQFKLSFTKEWFRAYEIGAGAGGGLYTSTEDGGYSVTSTGSGGGQFETSEPGVWALSPSQYLLPDFMNLSGYHFHDTTIDASGTHNHGIEHGTTLLTDTGSVVWVQSGYHNHVLHNRYAGDHAHSMYSVSHTHAVDIPSHSHNVTLPNHRHNISLEDHTHNLVFGIYEGTAPADISVKLDGDNLTASLGGPFNQNMNDLELSSYVTSHGWHVLELVSSCLGRINASLFIQLFMYM